MKLEHGVADILTPEISANENINKPAFARPEFLSMYEISGQDEITEHSLVRYLSDKKQDQKIKEAAGNSPLLLEKKIIDSLKDERGRLIRAGLAQANLEIKIVCAQMIYCAFENERGKLIRMGLEQEDQETKRVCARMIMYVSASERVELIRMGLEQENPDTIKACANMIESVSKNEREILNKKVGKIVKAGLEQEDPETQSVYAEMIGRAPENEQEKLRTKVGEIVKAGLEQEDPKTQKICADMIWRAPKNEQEKLRMKVGEIVKAGLEQKDPETKKMCAKMIACAPENERGKLIRMGLEQEDQETKRVCARMIMYVSASERVELIRMGLEQEDLETRSICSKMIRYAFESDRKALLELAKKNLGDSIVEPRLYEKINVLKDKFSRKQFPKDGSETFLVGGQLKGKTIIRRIIPSAFMAWQKMYEDCGLWKNEGFDYVPVEPIISYHLNKQDLVDVYSGVLDLSLADWEILDGEFLGELNRDADKIKSVLRKQGVVHGHDCHSGNFCLRFFRDENGQVDFTKKPRIYLIDFDQAISS